MTMPPIESKDAGLLGLGSSIATMPIWGQLVSYATGINNFLLGLGGLIVVGLTIRNLWLKNKALKQEIEEIDQKSAGK